MRAEDFASRITSLAPTVEQLEQGGLDRREAMQIRRCLVCHRRSFQMSHQPSNEIVALMNNYETGKLQIGMFRFRDSPVSHASCLHVAHVEADPVLILSGEQVVVRELGAPQHTLWLAAERPEKLLDALAIAREYLSRGSFDDSDLLISTVEACAAAAGGDEYAGLYRFLLDY